MITTGCGLTPSHGWCVQYVNIVEVALMWATSTKNKYTFSNCSCTMSLTCRWCLSLCLRCWPCVAHSVKHMQITEWACSISPTKHIQVVTNCCTSVAVSGCWRRAFHNRFAPCLLHCNKNPYRNQIFVHTFYLQKLDKTTFLSHLTIFLSSYPKQKEHVLTKVKNSLQQCPKTLEYNT